ncbi:MAG: diguanylate cyclase domain-containing protein [Bacillota bacterium]
MDMTIKTIPYGKHETRNAYVLFNDYTGIIIDPGNRESASAILHVLKEHDLSISKFETVVVQSAHCSNLSGLAELSDNGLSSTVIVNARLPETFETLTIKTLDEIGNEWSLNDELTLRFYPAPFLPFPDSFCTYFVEEERLFSSHLFSQVDTDGEEEQSFGSLIYYHESIMPSSDFLKPVMKELSALTISEIHPLKGRTIQSASVKEVVNRLRNLEFYNNHNVVSRRKKYNKYDYMEILNHMLKRLSSHYDNKEIAKVFKDSSIVLVKNGDLEIDKTSLKGYKLWNGFFEQIYKKKGIGWLVILEPLVRKYSRLYNILKPSIYKSELMKRQKALSRVHEEKTALEEQVDRLTEQLTKTSDQLLRDDLTALYNEQFFRKHLSNELNDYDLDSERLGFLLIRVDRFKRLNRQYGKAAGDETIRNLSYIIERVKPENTLLFRQNGPGFFLYFGFSSIKKMKEIAKKISNAVKDSDLFIEPISVSEYVATSDDITDYDSKQALALKLISESRLKLERAQTAGSDLILDVKTVGDTYKEGYILVVDEDETMQNLLMLIFNRLHFEVLIAKDIYEAFETVKSTPVDAIISEINLSKLDGLQFKRWLNESHTYQSIPFIIASHHKNADIIKRCNALSVDYVLRKPLITEEITGIVQRLRKRNAL